MDTKAYARELNKLTPVLHENLSVLHTMLVKADYSFFAEKNTLFLEMYDAACEEAFKVFLEEYIKGERNH